MNTTIQKKQSLLLNGSPLLPQLAAKVGNDKYRLGKLAYDSLGAVLAGPATEIRTTADGMTLAKLTSCDLSIETQASVAFATAAFLDVARANRGRRMTVTEHVEETMDQLDKELAAGW